MFMKILIQETRKIKHSNIGAFLFEIGYLFKCVANLIEGAYNKIETSPLKVEIKEELLNNKRLNDYLALPSKVGQRKAVGPEYKVWQPVALMN